MFNSYAICSKIKKESIFNNPNNSTAAVNAIVFTDADGLILFIMRNQALVAKLLDVNVTVHNEEADLANIDGIALLNEYLVTVVIGRLHTVTAVTRLYSLLII